MRLVPGKLETVSESQRDTITISREALKQIVSDAVIHAIGAFDAQRRAVEFVPRTVPTKFERLQTEMGLNDIDFAGTASPWPSAPVAPKQLSDDMGVAGFEFDDAQASAEESAAAISPAVDTALATWEEALKEFQEP